MNFVKIFAVNSSAHRCQPLIFSLSLSLKLKPTCTNNSQQIKLNILLFKELQQNLKTN